MPGVDLLLLVLRFTAEGCCPVAVQYLKKATGAQRKAETERKSVGRLGLGILDLLTYQRLVAMRGFIQGTVVSFGATRARVPFSGSDIIIGVCHAACVPPGVTGVVEFLQRHPRTQ